MQGRHGRCGGKGWQGRLRGLGYRITGPREAVLAALAQADGHLSAKDIFLRVQRACPACGLNTVYRTLEMLTRTGMVTRSEFGDGQARYELRDKPGRQAHHHHLVCIKCGKVLDYGDFMAEESELFGKIEKGLLKKFNFKITDHELTFKGICGDCARKV